LYNKNNRLCRVFKLLPLWLLNAHKNKNGDLSKKTASNEEAAKQLIMPTPH